MGLTNLTADLDLIQALDKRPNAIGGLSAAQLQAKFDEAANAIKTYINGTLIPELDTQVAALKAVNRLVYCAQDVPKTALPADIITVGKNWFYPKPEVGDTVLGKNMYVARVTTIAGNDATLTGIGTVLTPKDFNVMNLLTVKAVGGVGGNIVAEGDLSVSGYTGLAGDLDVTGDTDITGDLDVVGNVTVTVDATVSGALDVTGPATFGDDVSLAPGNTLTADAVDTKGVVLSDGIQGDTSVSIYGANDEIELFGDNDGPVSLLNVKDISASGDGSIGGDATVHGTVNVGDDLNVTSQATIGGDLYVTGDTAVGNLQAGALEVINATTVGGDLDVTGDISGDNLTLEDDLTAVNGTFSGDVSASGDLYGTELNLTNNSNKSVQIEVSAENMINFNGTSDAPVVINNVDTPTANGHAANKSYVDSALSGKADEANPYVSGTITITDTNNASVYVANTGDVLVLAGHNHSAAVEIGNVATPTTNGSAANKAYVDTAASGRVAVAQGVGHAGEFLVVGSDGNVTTVTMTAWAGGSY